MLHICHDRPKLHTELCKIRSAAPGSMLASPKGLILRAPAFRTDVIWHGKGQMLYISYAPDRCYYETNVVSALLRTRPVPFLSSPAMVRSGTVQHRGSRALHLIISLSHHHELESVVVDIQELTWPPRISPSPSRPSSVLKGSLRVRSLASVVACATPQLAPKQLGK